MNVLPVIVDLLPPPKLDSPAQGVGSSLDGFARILDRTLTEAPPPESARSSFMSRPNTPYVSPTRQNSEQRQPQTGRIDGPPSKGEPSPSTSAPERPPIDHSTSGRSTRRRGPEAGRAEAQNGPSKDGRAGLQGRKEPSKSAAGSPASNHETKHGTQASAHVHSNSASHGDQKSGKKETSVARTAAGVLFPGALILAGARKSTAKAAVAKPGETIGKLDLATTGAKSAKGTPTAKNLSGFGPGAGKKSPVPKGQKTGGKNHGENAAIGSQLVAAPVASATNAAAPQVMGAAVHAGPGYSNIQQDAGNAGAQNTPTDQAAAVTIIDLRSHNQNTGSSTGQSNGQNQPNDGGNVRLFQIMDGGTAAGAKMSGQAGPAGAPTGGQNFSALTDQIVKQTGILLKNQNSGEIRLVLRPEKLGNLRIKLELNNNNLSGKIFVQNHEALRLVQQNLDSLYRALRDSGFTATSLNVSVGGRDHGERDKQRSSPLPSMRAIESVKGFENQTPALETAGSYYSLVNLVI